MLAARCTMRTFLFILCLPFLVGPALATEAELVLENPLFRYTISPDAGNVAFVDRATGTNHLRTTGRPPAHRFTRKGRNSQPLQPRWRKGT